MKEGKAAAPHIFHYLHVWLPAVGCFFGAVGDLAAEAVSFGRGEGHAAGQVEVPVALEGQVGLLSVGHLLTVLQQLDGDVWRVELADVADQHVVLPELSGHSAVHLHFGWT